MPHKHKRKRGEDADYDLPPSQKAQPLPAFPKSKQQSGPGAQRTGKKRNKGRRNDDDAPRAFKRLMAVAQGRKVKSGLDDGNDGKSVQKDAQAEIPRIRPGEDMRMFAARVNAALPVSGLTKKIVVKDGKDEAGLRVYRTRKERKMHKLYDQWRAEERKIQEKREEEAELEAQRELENDAAGITSNASMFDPDDSKGKGKKETKRQRGQAEEDPWLELKRKRAEAKISLHDTAQAPPELHKKMSWQLKVGGAAVDVDSVPKAAGSLRRREELQGVRQDVVDAYRKIREHEQAKLSGSKGF